MQPSGHDIANSSAVMVKHDHSPDRDIRSQEKIVKVGKAALKQDKLEADEVNARVDYNLVEPVRLGTELTLDSDGPLRIRLYSSPKRRNVPVVRDFPVTCKQSSEQDEQSENDIEDVIQYKESSKNDQKHSFPDDPEEDSDRLESVPLESEQISGQADQEIKEPLTYEDDVCESEESLMNSEILALIEDVEVKSDRLVSVPKVSDQISGQADQEIKGPLTYEDDVCESEESLMNSEILALTEDVEVKSDRLESVPKVSDQISGQSDQEIKGPLTYEDDVCESEESLTNSEILALIEDVKVKSDRLESVPKVSEQISGEVDQEKKGPLTYESDDSLMNSEILALIEDVEVESDGVNESEDTIMNSEILAMIEDVEVESNESVKKDGTDLTGLESSKASKVPRRRVSAIRCFPPGCGRNAVRLSKEEFKKAIAESKNHCSSCSCTEPEGPFLEDEESEQDDEGKEKKSSERS